MPDSRSNEIVAIRRDSSGARSNHRDTSPQEERAGERRPFVTLPSPRLSPPILMNHSRLLARRFPSYFRGMASFDNPFDERLAPWLCCSRQSSWRRVHTSTATGKRPPLAPHQPPSWRVAGKVLHTITPARRQLRCLVTKTEDGPNRARFHAVLSKGLTFVYTVPLTVERTTNASTSLAR